MEQRKMIAYEEMLKTYYLAITEGYTNINLNPFDYLKMGEDSVPAFLYMSREVNEVTTKLNDLLIRYFSKTTLNEREKIYPELNKLYNLLLQVAREDLFSGV